MDLYHLNKTHLIKWNKLLYDYNFIQLEDVSVTYRLKSGYKTWVRCIVPMIIAKSVSSTILSSSFIDRFLNLNKLLYSLMILPS
jgi:hypothetical protein